MSRSPGQACSHSSQRWYSSDPQDMAQVPAAVSSSLAEMPPSCEPYECLQTVTPLCRLPICPNPSQAQRPFHPGMPTPCTG